MRERRSLTDGQARCVLWRRRDDVLGEHFDHAVDSFVRGGVLFVTAVREHEDIGIPALKAPEKVTNQLRLAHPRGAADTHAHRLAGVGDDIPCCSERRALRLATDELWLAIGGPLGA